MIASISDDDIRKTFNDLIKEDNNKLKNLKLDALNIIFARHKAYIEECYNKELAFIIFLHRFNFLVDAKSKKDIDIIMKPSIPKYNNTEFTPANEYHILAEELLLWSRASLKAPLNTFALKRYIEVFKMVLPEKIKNLDF